MTTPSKAGDFDETTISNITTSRNLIHCDPELAKKFYHIDAHYRKMMPGRSLLITCTYRSPEEQFRLYKKGRFGNPGGIITNCDGDKIKSRHNYFPSQAIDVVVIDAGKCIWAVEDETAYHPIGPLARQIGLEWGGFWTNVKFQDPYHIQLPKGAKT